MNSRMNRLRRSLSRSVHQLGSLSRAGSLSGLVQLPSNASGSTLCDRFATPSNFSQLKQTIQANNEALREVINVFEEKAALDFQYSKALQKLSARLHKVAHQMECDIDKGWTAVAEQFDVHATLHSNLGSAMTDDVVQPLRAIQVNHQKTIRAAETLVDRETRKWKDKREDSIRSKKSLYENSKQLEKVELSEENTTATTKTPGRRQKLREQVRKQEDAYLWDTIDVEKQRRVAENVLRKGVESLEAVERQRLAHCQTALGRYQRKIDQLAPNLQQMFERHANNLDVAVQATASDYICTMQPSSSAVNSVLLTDFYAENFGEVMSSERRRAALERINETLDVELKRMYGQGSAQIMATNTRQITLVEYIEYIYYKVNDALNSLEGGSSRGYHRLSRFQHRLKDKSGLPMTVLSIPLAGEDRSLPPPSLMDASSTAGKSDDEVEEYDKISDEGFYNSTNGSTSRQTNVIDEPGRHTSTLCRALYDFEPKHDDEILVKAGEVVLVEDKIGEDWLVGHVIGDKAREHLRGRFPTSYVAF